MFPDLIALLFFSRDYAHRAHLRSNAHSEHVVLQEFYEGILPHIDALVEAYQGDHGLVEIPYAHEDTSGLAPLEVLRRHLTVFKACRAQAFGDSAACNAIADEIEGLYLSTLYKLEYLL